MEHTWQTHFLPKLASSNLETGDVAVCGSFASPDANLSELDDDRISFVAPLDSRSELEWLLRGLHLHPRIHHLVLCGDDPKTVGESLIALWQRGLDGDGQLPDSRGRLSAECDIDGVETLRSDVEIVDLRGKSTGDVASHIANLPIQSAQRETRSLANPIIPERKVFLSRMTTFPIFSSDVADSWLQLLNLTLRIGTEKQASGGESFAEALNAVVTIDTPVLEDGEQAENAGQFPGYVDFNSDDFDRFYFDYCDRLRNREGGDPIAAVSDRLEASLDTRSGTMVFQESGESNSRTLASSLISATFNVVDQKLYGSYVLRSCDVYTDWPLEAMALVRLQGEMAEALALEVGTSTFVVHSAHLYERDWDRSERALGEFFKRPLPLHVDPSGVFLFGSDAGKARAMLLNHDASRIQWEEAFSDPEDLSWYIVDVMPWLLPQHIRYVGQECAALMRAMKEGECYLQG